MALTCAINSGRCRVVGKGAAVTSTSQRPSSGLNELTQEPSLDKNAHRGSLAGPEPLSSKAVCLCCLTWKDPAKQFPFLESASSRQVELRQTECGRSSFMPSASEIRCAGPAGSTSTPRVGNPSYRTFRHAVLSSCVVFRIVEADWRLLFYRRTKCTYRKQCFSFLPFAAMACDSNPPNGTFPGGKYRGGY